MVRWAEGGQARKSYAPITAGGSGAAIEQRGKLSTGLSVNKFSHFSGPLLRRAERKVDSGCVMQKITVRVEPVSVEHRFCASYCAKSSPHTTMQQTSLKTEETRARRLHAAPGSWS